MQQPQQSQLSWVTCHVAKSKTLSPLHEAAKQPLSS